MHALIVNKQFEFRFMLDFQNSIIYLKEFRRQLYLLIDNFTFVSMQTFRRPRGYVFNIHRS